MKTKPIHFSKNLQNSIWNILEVVLSPLILFLSIPLFLEQLGNEDYGIWMFVNTVIIVFQTFNLGLNFSTYKHVSEAISNKNKQEITTTLNVNLSLNIIIFILVIFLISAFTFSIHKFDIFIDNADIKTKLISCIFIGLVIIFTKLTEQILYNVYRAFENFKYVTVITILIKLVTVVGNIFIAYQTQNIIYILIFTAFTSVVGLIINYAQLVKFIPSYSFKFTLSKILIKKEINYSLFIWLQSIAVIITYQGDRFLVSYEFGISTLTLYAIVAKLFNHIHMAFGAFTSWVFPQVAKNKNDKVLIFNMYLATRNISVVFSIFLLCLFCLLTKPIFLIWIGSEKFNEMSEYVKWFSIFEFFFIFTIIPNYFLNASGHEKFNLKMVLMFTSINLLGIVIGFLILKTTVGILIGLALSTIIGMFILHYKMAKKFDESNKSTLNVALLFIPSFFGSGTAWFDSYSLKMLSFSLCMLSLYLIYIKLFRTDFKLLTE